MGGAGARRRNPERSLRGILSGIRVNRLLLALTAYVALGVLTWTTIEDQRVRMMTLAILGLFAFKTYLRRNEVLHSKEDVEK